MLTQTTQTAATPSLRQRLLVEIALLQRAGQTVNAEVETELELVEGSLPAELRGVLYRNGPGRMERGGVRYGHPFDGDGMVTRFAFAAGHVRYRNRFVRTRQYQEEEAAGRILYRNFGTSIPGGVLRNLLRLGFKNAANTSVVRHGGILLALWEAGLPHRLDPETLETLGEHDFGGALRNRGLAALLAPDLPFSAHPKLDEVDGALHNFGTVLGSQNELLLYKVERSGRLSGIERLPLSRLPFLHDFVLTPRYRVFYLASVSFAVAAMLLGVKTPVEALRGDPTGKAELLLVPRDGGAPRYFPAEGGFIFHFAGGYDDPQGAVVVDGLRSARFPEFERLWDPDSFAQSGYTPPLLTRFVVSPERGLLKTEVLCDHPLELPTTHPALAAGRPYRYVYGIGGRPGLDLPIMHGLVKADVQERTVVYRDFGDDLPGEPVFVPRVSQGAVPSAPSGSASEDDGFLITLIYCAQTHASELLVLCAKDLRTLARLRLPHHVPPGFHGTFVPAPGV